ncbi:class I SAM-dependent methyltransferase [Actinopolyspora saharensis]|uniref:Methyltransferase domain-containing protein n=1 Tax=Actinopolyspora saharensis TaxID=995062 RepID=A0A1H1FAG1_9ACTN|nr:class I SAM-dependent methyltransferase [Actinopolyspora saharensis]SDQ97907.1 Methyltransferase domain-containing protein [Actinopolyspora saharensis]
MSTTEQSSYDFTNADFDAVYTGGDFLPGADIEGVPWDIGQAQPEVVEMERLGRFTGEVLDVGCGPGDNAVFLAGRGHAVTAIDAASAAIAEARQRAHGLDVTFDVADATELEGYAGSFDSVLDSALFHTLGEEGRRHCVRALHRVTRPGGRLSMLCFADVAGGMPEPLSVSEKEVRSVLDEAGWEITHLSSAVYLGLPGPVRGFFEKVGSSPELDEQGHTRLPVWRVFADRRSA